MGIDVHQYDVPRSPEQVVKLRRSNMRGREIRLHLRQTVHVCAHGLTHCVFDSLVAHYQALIDGTRGGGQQTLVAVRATH